MADYFTHFSCLLDVGTPSNALTDAFGDRRPCRMRNRSIGGLTILVEPVAVVAVSDHR